MVQNLSKVKNYTFLLKMLQLVSLLFDCVLFVGQTKSDKTIEAEDVKTNNLYKR